MNPQDFAKTPDITESSASIPEIDYLGRDFEAFRENMLATLKARAPSWDERNPVDQGVALVEVLAYVGDYMSYYQDAVGTEAYLATARSRISLRRHARLLDDRLQEGSNARVWVAFDVSQPVHLPRGTALLTRVPRLPTAFGLTSEHMERASQADPRQFETMVEVDLRPEHNQLEVIEPKGGRPSIGATWARLKGHLPMLSQGTVLIFESLGSPGEKHLPAAAVRLSAPPRLSGSFDSAVTEIHWLEQDALPEVWRQWFEASEPDAWRLLGNTVLADDGRTVSQILPAVPTIGRYSPELERSNLTFSQPLSSAGSAACELLRQDLNRVLPEIRLFSRPPESLRHPNGGQDMIWFPAYDLLGSNRFAPRFVAEVNNDKRVSLRFGDDRFGRRPRAGSSFKAIYRVGKGPAGNIGPHTLFHVISDQAGIEHLWNPRGAQGGTVPESSEELRQRAPFAFHRQLRCVSDQDYLDVALRQPKVRAAQVTRTSHRALLRIQTKGRIPLQPNPIEKAFENFLLLGTTLEIKEPIWVDLQIQLDVKVLPSHSMQTMRALLLELFRSYFAGDPYTFGEAVELAPILDRARSTPGVVSALAVIFKRRDQATNDGLLTGRIEMAADAIAVIRDQAAFQVNVEVDHGI